MILDDDDDDDDAFDSVTPFVSYSLYQVLGNKIKLSRNNGRKVSSCALIDILFDKVMFEGVLATFGTDAGTK